MRKLAIVVAAAVVGLLLVLDARAAPAASVADELDAARKTGRTVFLLVSEAGAKDIEGMRKSAREAQAEAPHVALVEMDRRAQANLPIVKRYGLLSARLPLVLVLAHNGAPAGGATPGKEATKRLLSLLPSPRKADTLLALFQGKAAFIVVARPAMPSRAAALERAAQAVLTLEGKAAVIEIDPLDKHEQAFLATLGADLGARDVVVHVYGLSGQKTGAFAGAPSVEALVEAARKKAACCPGGKCG